MNTDTVAVLPHVQFHCGGVLVPETVSAALLSVAVTHRLNEPCRCCFDLADNELGPTPDDSFPLGSELTITLEGNESPLFRGTVDRVTCERRPSREERWIVEATDGLQTLVRNRHMRVFVQMKPAAIVGEVAGAHGLDMAAHDDGPLLDRVVQQGETDLDFLRRLLEEAGLSLVVIGDVVHVFGAHGRGPRLTLDGVRQVLDLRHSHSHRRAPASIRFSGTNFLTHQLHTGDASVEADTGRLDGEWFWPGAVEDSAQAQRRAAAAGDRFRQGLAVLEGTVEGELDVYPGRQIRMERSGGPFDGNYTVTQVLHRIDGEGGFVTEFSTQPPDGMARQRAAIAAYGTVTRLDDPEAQGRVQVVLPAYDDVELGWLRVLTLGAGKNKGLVMLPDIGEDVLVLFPAADPAQAIVLGGIYGQSDHPEWGIEEKAVRRFALTSAGGQKVVLSDGKHSVRVENDAGSAIEIGEDKITIEAKGDLEISAPGKAIRIVAHTVDFEQG